MAGAVNITVNAAAMRVLAAELAVAAAESTALVTAAVTKTAYDIQATAQALCPVDTGFLRNSISVSLAGLSAEVGPTAEYAPYVEYGTSRMAPQPFMEPAAAQHESALEEAVNAVLAGLL